PAGLPWAQGRGGAAGYRARQAAAIPAGAPRVVWGPRDARWFHAGGRDPAWERPVGAGRRWDVVCGRRRAGPCRARADRAPDGGADAVRAHALPLAHGVLRA